MKIASLRWLGAAAVVVAVLAACGGGGGDPGECQGSAEVCKRSSSTATPASNAVAHTLGGQKQATRAHLDKACLWCREVPTASSSALDEARHYFYPLTRQQAS